jgi:hypothetical protein
MGSMQCNVEFGYQLSICSRTKENPDRVGNRLLRETERERERERKKLGRVAKDTTMGGGKKLLISIGRFPGIAR